MIVLGLILAIFDGHGMPGWIRSQTLSLVGKGIRRNTAMLSGQKVLKADIQRISAPLLFL